MEENLLQKYNVDEYTLFEWHWMEDLTFKQIAERLGCAVGTIHKLFSRYGILRKQRKYGWKLSDEARLAISKRTKGKTPSDETRKRMSESAKKRFSDGSHSVLWKGGKKHRFDGYVAVWLPEHPFAKSGYVMEHRLVMEKEIGRYLTREEVVHHINGRRDDNRIENLKLFPNGAEHQRYHALHTRERDERGFFKHGQ